VIDVILTWFSKEVEAEYVQEQEVVAQEAEKLRNAWPSLCLCEEVKVVSL